KHDAVLGVALAFLRLRGLIGFPDPRPIVRMNPAVHPVDRRQRLRRLDAAYSKHFRGHRESARRKIVSPTAGMAQSLRFEQVGFAPSQLLLRLLACIDVRQQVVPADDPTLDVAKREAARLEPPILAIRPTEAVLEFVWQPGVA